jgi:uncharacterized membrane protein HdeD (DUF308 family)
MGFALFMASATGRWLRVIVGLALVAVGLVLAFQPANMITGIILAVVGLVPLLAGIVDVCFFAPLFGAPFNGPKIRAAASHQA